MRIANNSQLVVFTLILPLIANVLTAAPIRTRQTPLKFSRATKTNVDAWKGWMELRFLEEKEQGENSVVLSLNSSYIRGAVGVLYYASCHHRST